MDVFPIFNVEPNDFETLLNMAGQEVYVNGRKKIGLISNTDYVKDYNDKYLSTNFNMQRGDIIYYDSKHWMLISQVGTPRYESYKTLMRQVEHTVYFNLYNTNNPPEKYLLKTPAIVQQTADFGAEYSRSTETITVYSEIHVFIQDNEKTRKIMELTNKSDEGIIFGDRQYEIVGVSTINKGALDITCRLTTIGVNTHIEQGIVGELPDNWNDYVDDFMFATDKDFAPNGLQTDVGMINVVAQNATSNVQGSITITWNDEVNKAKYIGFNGYQLRLYKDNIEIERQNIGVLSPKTYVFNVDTGNYKIEIYSLFSTYSEGESSLPQTTDIIFIEQGLQLSPPPADLKTDVGTITATAEDVTYNGGTDGKVNLEWSRDVNADNYAGFVGYKIELYKSGGWSYYLDQTVEVGDVTSYQFTNKAPNTYYVDIYTKFINGNETFYATEQESDSVYVNPY